ncbi:MAG: hypothetical protein M3O89_04770 [Actinomycetota bacterium]|nr:hypothetical protein [Actinomycetota bacterium]
MTDPIWRTVFDASNKPLDWVSMVAALPFLGAAIVMWLFRGHPEMRRRGGAIFPVVIGGFALLWTVAVSASLGLQYLAAQSALKDGTARVVEGPIKNFHPMPLNFHDTERFDVDGVHFEYGATSTAGFDNTSSHGGPVHADEYVRIHYINGASGPVIVRLEIREAP